MITLKSVLIVLANGVRLQIIAKVSYWNFFISNLARKENGVVLISVMVLELFKVNILLDAVLAAK